MDDQTSEGSCCCNPCGPGHGINRQSGDLFARQGSRQEGHIINVQIKSVPPDVTVFLSRHSNHAINRKTCQITCDWRSFSLNYIIIIKIRLLLKMAAPCWVHTKLLYSDHWFIEPNTVHSDWLSKTSSRSLSQTCYPKPFRWRCWILNLWPSTCKACVLQQRYALPPL